MTRTSLAGLIVLLVPASLLAAGPGVAPSPESPALFSARSARLGGGALILADLRETDPKAGGRMIAGRVLIGGDEAAQLGLWALKVGAEMGRAAPFLGREGPCISFLKTGGSAARLSIPFRAPVRVTLTDLDANGAVSHVRRLNVRTMRLEGVRP